MFFFFLDLCLGRVLDMDPKLTMSRCLWYVPKRTSNRILSTRRHVSAAGTHRDLDVNLLPLESRVTHSSIERKTAGIDGVTLSLWRTAEPPDTEYYLQYTMHDNNVPLAFVQLSDLLHTVRPACGMNRLRLRPEARTYNLQQCGNNFEVRVFGVIEIISRQLRRHDSSQHPFDGTRELPLTPSIRNRVWS
jgi:hypothetical protein